MTRKLDTSLVAIDMKGDGCREEEEAHEAKSTRRASDSNCSTSHVIVLPLTRCVLLAALN